MRTRVEASAQDITLQPSLTPIGTKGETICVSIRNGADELFVFWDNYRLTYPLVRFDDDMATITIPSNASKYQRSHIRVLSLIHI